MVLIYQDLSCLTLFKQRVRFLSVRIEKRLNKFDSWLFQRRETNLRFVSLVSYETQDSDHWLDNMIEVVNQNSIVQYSHENNPANIVVASLV